MNVNKVINFERDRKKNEPEVRFIPEGGAKIIERREFHHWLGQSVAVVNDHNDVASKFRIIQTRLDSIKMAFENNNGSEIVTQSARISLLAEQIGLPRTAKLAADIGEAQMAGHFAKTWRLILKLQDIVAALDSDFQRDAK